MFSGERAAATRAQPAHLDRHVVPILRAAVAAGPTAVVLIDGPSGAGKSTLADALMAAWPIAELPGVASMTVLPQLVRLDDMYPGWDGLDAASAQLTDRLLRPRANGEPAAWQRYDWSAGKPAEWMPVAAGRPLVVEGCGTLAAANAGLSDVRVWLDADDGVRKRRALARDGDTFGSHWDQWQQEWVTYCVRETPVRWATIRLFSTKPG